MGRIHFIGGEKGGVGKSVMTRIIAQYCIDRNLPFVGYDTDRSHGSFSRFYQSYASPVLVDSFTSLDQVVETLCADPTRLALIDLAAQTLQPLRTWMEASGTVELLTEQQHRAVFWHVLDDTKDSLATLDALFAAFADSVSYVLVLNHGRGSTFTHVEDSPQMATAQTLGAQVVHLQRLHETSMRKIDQADASFWAAINRSGSAGTLGLLERQRVKVWLRRIYQELDPILGAP